jgi:hypothetical protein
MKRLFLVSLSLVTLMLACNIPAPGTALPATNQPPAPTETPPLQETPTVTPTATIAPNVQCNELSFYLDPAVAAHYSCETVPEDLENDPWQLPRYTAVTLTGYALPDQPLFQRIHVYRLADFLAVQPRLTSRVDDLRALIAGGAPPEKGLPVLDLFGAAQQFHAHYQVVPFANGSGIRFVSQYAQYLEPINNNASFLVFQGLTNDGQFYISAVLRISNPILQALPEPFPGGMSQEQFNDQYDSYIADITAQLNAQPEAAFIPSITLLDALIGSIVIQP